MTRVLTGGPNRDRTCDQRIKDNVGNTCQISNDKIICLVKYNSDDSSNFFPTEISFLAQLWGEEAIIAQKGFFNSVNT